MDSFQDRAVTISSYRSVTIFRFFRRMFKTIETQGCRDPLRLLCVKPRVSSLRPTAAGVCQRFGLLSVSNLVTSGVLAFVFCCIDSLLMQTFFD